MKHQATNRNIHMKESTKKRWIIKPKAIFFFATPNKIETCGKMKQENQHQQTV